MTGARTILAVLSLAAVVIQAGARSHYRDKIPNGHNVKDDAGDNWNGVGHNNSGGGGTLNPFGQAFLDAGLTWTQALCNADSDGDGRSNGVELGDPGCTWQEGQNPTFDRGITHPGFASAEATIETCTGFTLPPASETDLEQVELRFPSYTVPHHEHTTYAKYAFNMHDMIAAQNNSTPPTRKHYGVRFVPLIENVNVVHHQILYACRTRPTAFEAAPSTSGNMPCTDLVFAWAVGGNDFCLPTDIEGPGSGVHVGIEFDHVHENAWYVLEIHYDNPNQTAGIVDTSGVRVDLVSPKHQPTNFDLATLRYVSGGVLWAGSGLGEMTGAGGVPGGMHDYRLQAACRYEAIPDSGVTVFGYVNHAHTIGRKLWTSVYRQGQYAFDAGCDPAYDFDLQQIAPFDRFQLYNTDTLIANCIYDSRSRPGIDCDQNSDCYVNGVDKGYRCKDKATALNGYQTQGKHCVTRGGDETGNEMCINFFVYYPKVGGVQVELPDGSQGLSPPLNPCLTIPQPRPTGNKQCCSIPKDSALRTSRTASPQCTDDDSVNMRAADYQAFVLQVQGEATTYQLPPCVSEQYKAVGGYGNIHGICCMDASSCGVAAPLIENFLSFCYPGSANAAARAAMCAAQDQYKLDADVEAAASARRTAARLAGREKAVGGLKPGAVIGICLSVALAGGALYYLKYHRNKAAHVAPGEVSEGAKKDIERLTSEVRKVAPAPEEGSVVDLGAQAPEAAAEAAVGPTPETSVVETPGGTAFTVPTGNDAAATSPSLGPVA
jgi:hypothetical protein